jgi:thiamine kinase-like enzyme
MFRLTERYLALCDERGFAVPDGYRAGIAAVPRIEEAFAARPLPTVPCHNDLLAENYIDDGATLRIVDYEYSGNNDPTFELGNTCQELGWDESRIVALCGAYFGEATPALVARMKLNMIMSDVGWTLWAAIQARISPIAYDFWGWAEERWGRAATKLTDPAFEGWLETVGSAET